MSALSLFDRRALAYLAKGRSATHHVAYMIGFFDTRRPRLDRTRTLLRRLARHGLVEVIRSQPGRSSWWRITDAGRALVAGEGA